jgi:hypothetical protein
MATILRAPERLTAAQKKSTTTLYLAGPFEDDGDADQPGSWRDDVIAACADLDITIIDPRNDRWCDLAPGSPGRRGAYDWQCAAAFTADVVIVWVPEGCSAPTALMILGHLGAKRNSAAKGNTVIVGGGAWDGLVQLYAQNQRLFPAGDDLTEVVRLARLQLQQAMAAQAAS